MPSSHPDDNDDAISSTVVAALGIGVAQVGVSAHEAHLASGGVDGNSGLEADVGGSGNGYLQRHLS